MRGLSFFSPQPPGAYSDAPGIPRPARLAQAVQGYQRACRHILLFLLLLPPRFFPSTSAVLRGNSWEQKFFIFIIY